MGQEYNEKVFLIIIPSILHGELVGAGSLMPKGWARSLPTPEEFKSDQEPPPK
jgi:hypothetical protein